MMQVMYLELHCWSLYVLQKRGGSVRSAAHCRRAAVLIQLMHLATHTDGVNDRGGEAPTFGRHQTPERRKLRPSLRKFWNWDAPQNTQNPKRGVLLMKR